MSFKKENNFFIYKKPCHFARNYPQGNKSKDPIHLFDEIPNDTGIYLSKENDIELIFS